MRPTSAINMSQPPTYPIGASLTLADLAGEVHPLLHKLRAAEPVSWLPVLNAWLETGYGDAAIVDRKSVV